MSVTYKFYVQMDGEIYGPYSAQGIRDLDLLDDILVTEESMNGQWLPAARFDFDDMVRKESGIPAYATSQFSSVVNTDGTVTNTGNWTTGNINQINSDPYFYDDNVEEETAGFGWCILAFFFPIVGWILYFCWRDNKPRKASKMNLWAWIGFSVGITFNIIVRILASSL